MNGSVNSAMILKATYTRAPEALRRAFKRHRTRSEPNSAIRARKPLIVCSRPAQTPQLRRGKRRVRLKGKKKSDARQLVRSTCRCRSRVLLEHELAERAKKIRPDCKFSGCESRRPDDRRPIATASQSVDTLRGYVEYLYVEALA